MAFNANKSKCLVVQPRQNRGLPSSNLPPPDFHGGGNDSEIVSEYPHLCHIISSHCLDDSDIFIDAIARLGKLILLCATVENCLRL